MLPARSETRPIVQGAAQGPRAVTDDRSTGSGPGTGRKDSERTQMDIDGTSGIGRGLRPVPTQGPKPAPAGEFARAGQLADDLAARGQQVRFDTHRLTGRVVASLCDTDGRVLRPVSLRDVLGTEPD